MTSHAYEKICKILSTCSPMALRVLLWRYLYHIRALQHVSCTSLASSEITEASEENYSQVVESSRNRVLETFRCQG
jgi:hypothetical protein